ncbi:hypothetical protein T484DRAFT_1848180 [Baffinella frigidus]|nr:hypothetical protein T484DRAFT_1848180 [Cryptophyta sp. CCMP2293]
MGFKLPAAVQRNAMNRIAVEGRDTVIASPTGSGKSLAYLVPLLSVLSDELLDADVTRYFQQFKTPELLDADVTRYFQQFKTPEDEREKDSEAPATPLAVAPLAFQLLGGQCNNPAFLPKQTSQDVALLAFQLLGGQRNNPAFLPERIPSNFEPGSKTNMFSYKGPRKSWGFVPGGGSEIGPPS